LTGCPRPPWNVTASVVLKHVAAELRKHCINNEKDDFIAVNSVRTPSFAKGAAEPRPGASRSESVFSLWRERTHSLPLSSSSVPWQWHLF